MVNSMGPFCARVTEPGGASGAKIMDQIHSEPDGQIDALAQAGVFGGNPNLCCESIQVPVKRWSTSLRWRYVSPTPPIAIKQK